MDNSDAVVEHFSSKFEQLLLSRGHRGANATCAELVACFTELGIPIPELDGLNKDDLKSVETATKLRTVGNAYNKDKNFHRALECYTKSACAAPYPKYEGDDATALAFAFANRSAVLYTMTMYDDCLKDIEQALKFGYPDQLKYLLYSRRGDCLQIMGKMREAEESFQEAANALSLDVDLAETEKKTKKLTLIRLQLDRIKQGHRREEVYKPKQQRAPPELAYGVNAKIPAASSCVEIAYTPEWGRHIRATRDIKPGEAILVEDPYVSTLSLDKFLVFCHNCLERCVSLIPCKTCRIVGFCSEKCQEIGMTSIHDIECPILVQLVKLVEDKHMYASLRILILASKRCGGLRGLYNQVQKIEKNSSDGRIKGTNDEGQYLSSDYTAVHYLITDKEKWPLPTVITFIIQALIVLLCIGKQDVFNGELKTDASLRRFVGGLLLQHQLSSRINSFPAEEVDPENVMEKKCIGSKLYNVISLLNHSCMANAYVIEREKKEVVKTMLPISKGDQVFLDYQGKGSICPVAARQSFLLNNFYFECKCILCTLKIPDEELSHPLLYWQCLKCCAKLAQVAAYRSAVWCSQCTRMNQIGRLREEASKRLSNYKTIVNRVFFIEEDIIPELVEMLMKMSSNKETTLELLFAYKSVLKCNDMMSGRKIDKSVHSNIL